MGHRGPGAAAPGEVGPRVSPEAPTAWGGLFLEALRLDRWPPERVRERAREALELGVGGFVLFGGARGEVAELTRELRAAAGRPIWLAADLERGAGQQFRGAVPLPPPAALAAHPEPAEATRRAGAITGREARELGLNWALAPVLDLDVEPRNPIVGTRSFGADAERVGRLGRIWVQACQAEGVAACAKHFPGHGRTVTDSHLELPAVREPRPVLERDLQPFRAVADSVASVMTAHVAYPALGAEGPATLSPAVLEGLLRRELGFRGLVVTDALIMAGLHAAAGAGEVEAEGRLAARAVAAGCDVLLYPGDLRRAVKGVAAAAERDEGFAARARQALRRSREACEERDMAGPAAGRPGTAAIGGEEDVVDLAAACLRATADPATAELSRGAPTEILRLAEDAPDGAEKGRMELGEAFAAELRGLGWSVTEVRELEAPARDRGGGGGAAPQRVVLVAWTPRAGKGRALLPDPAVRAVRRAVVEGGNGAPAAWTVVLGHPRVLEQLAVPGTCAWWSEPLMERAAARWLDARIR